jgi:hypothetical protein
MVTNVPFTASAPAILEGKQAMDIEVFKEKSWRNLIY